MNETATSSSPAHEPQKEGVTHPHLTAVRNAAQSSRDRVRESYRRFDAAIARSRFRLLREAAGSSVRTYRPLRDEPRLPNEGDDEFRARIRRERRKARAVASGRPESRPYTDLSQMTPEEKAQHKRELAAERQRKRRAKSKAILSSDLTIESVLDELPIEDLEPGRAQGNGHTDDPLWGIF